MYALCYFDLVQSTLIIGKTHSSEQKEGSGLDC